MNEPLVSIIIPTYNRPKRVKEATKSVLNQTYQNIEVIIVDDNSDYDLDRIRIHDERTTYLQNDENRGAPHSRNKGFEASNGAYVNFLDDDDLFLPSKIEKQINAFQADPSLDVVMCHVKYQRPEHDDITKNIPRADLHRALLKRYAVYSTGAHLIRRDAVKAIGGFDERLVANQEYDLHIRLSENHAYGGVDEALTVNREAPGQISYDFQKKTQATKQLWDKHKNKFKEHDAYAYNYARFTYLTLKYWAGQRLGKEVYLALP
jgi:glycosyltransferase involved in cell wall biosynthesis